MACMQWGSSRVETTNCPVCQKLIPSSGAKVDLHIEEEHSIPVEIIYAGIAKDVGIMLKDDMKKMSKTKEGIFRTKLKADRGDLEFTFIVDGEIFKTANNLKTIPGPKNVVKVVSASVPKTVRCCGYSFEKRFASPKSQYSGGRGESACTIIALHAISRMLTGPMISTPAHIDETLLAGIEAHNGICWRIPNFDSSKHLTPYEAYTYSKNLPMELDSLGWCQGDCGLDKFDKINTLVQFLYQASCPVAATLTTSAVTVAFCLPGENIPPRLFDSHSKDYGDEKPSGASVFEFSSVDQLIQFLIERFPQAEDVEMLGLSTYELNVYAKSGTLKNPNNQKTARQLFTENSTSSLPVSLDLFVDDDVMEVEATPVLPPARPSREIPVERPKRPEKVPSATEFLTVFEGSLRTANDTVNHLIRSMEGDKTRFPFLSVIDSMVASIGEASVSCIHSVGRENRERTKNEMLVVREWIELVNLQVSKVVNRVDRKHTELVNVLRDACQSLRYSWKQIRKNLHNDEDEPRGVQDLEMEHQLEETNAAAFPILTNHPGHAATVDEDPTKTKYPRPYTPPGSAHESDGTEISLRSHPLHLDDSTPKRHVEIEEGSLGDRNSSPHDSHDYWMPPLENGSRARHADFPLLKMGVGKMDPVGWTVVGSTQPLREQGPKKPVVKSVDLPQEPATITLLPKPVKAATFSQAKTESKIEEEVNKASDRQLSLDLENASTSMTTAHRVLRLIKEELRSSITLNLDATLKIGLRCTKCKLTQYEDVVSAFQMSARVHTLGCKSTSKALGFPNRPLQSKFVQGHIYCNCGDILGVVITDIDDKSVRCGSCHKSVSTTFKYIEPVVDPSLMYFLYVDAIELIEPED